MQKFDPLRDEGEVYGRKLHAAGNHVEVHRIYGAFHGFFALGIKFLHVQEIPLYNSFQVQDRSVSDGVV